MEVEEGKEVEEVEEFKEVEDEEHADPALESRLARKVTNFGMAVGRNYTPRRIRSETFNKAAESAFLSANFSRGMRTPFILNSFRCNTRFIFPN
jgi:hypothetical protein